MAPLNVCMIGTGEYTTGFVGGGQSGSDKKVGVVGLTMFDLRRRGKVDKLSMVGTSGNKFPAIRKHLHKNITEAYNGLDTTFTSYPGDDDRDPEAYKTAIDALSPGDAITIFTPDTTHHLPHALGHWEGSHKCNPITASPMRRRRCGEAWRIRSNAGGLEFAIDWTPV